MKKLLSLLGAATLLSTSTMFAVACGDPDEHKNDIGDSIFLNANIGGETIQITSSDVLWRLINETGPQNKSKFLQELVQLMNAGFLNSAKLANEANTENPISLEGNYSLDSMTKVLGNKYKDLETKVQREIDDEKEDAGDDWETTLEGKFPSLEGEGIEKLENQYRVEKIMNGTENVTTILIDTLLNTNQLGVSFLTKADLTNRLRDFRSRNIETKFADLSEEDKLLLPRLYIGISEDYSDTVLNTANEASEKTFEAVMDTNNSIKQESPESINEFVTSGSEKRVGMISNSQRYFLEYFFETQAPLAISEVTFAYAGDKKLSTTDISESLFTTSDNTDTKSDIDEFFKKTLGATPSESWDWVLNEGTVGKFGKGTAKKYSKLLTLSNSTDFTQMLRNSVYDFLGEKKHGVAATDLTSLLKANRAAAASMYAIIDETQGIIAFLEEDGLHFVRIDGFSHLKESKNTQGTNQGLTANGYINESTMKELGSFKKYHDLTNSADKVVAIQQTASETDSLYSKLNTAITNPYLKYLVNNSMVKGLTGAITDFDIMAEVKEFVKISSPATEGLYTWQTALLSYFKDVTNAGKPEEQTWEEFIETFMQFGTDSEEESSPASDSPDPEEISKNMLEWFASQIKNVESNVINNPFVDFKTKQDSENKAIQNNTEKFPKGQFAQITLANVSKIREYFVPYSTGTKTEFIFSPAILVEFYGGLK